MKIFRNRLEWEPVAEKCHRFLSQLIITDVDRALIAKIGEALECGLFLAYWFRLRVFFGFFILQGIVLLILLLAVNWNRDVFRLLLRNLFPYQFELNFWYALAI